MRGERRLARELALQALYEIDLVQHPPAQVMFEQFGALEESNPRAEEYARALVVGVMAVVSQLDAYIQSHAPEWPLDQVAVIDRNLLRMALYEFTVGKIPVKGFATVAANEGADSSMRFVNGTAPWYLRPRSMSDTASEGLTASSSPTSRVARHHYAKTTSDLDS